MVNTLSNRFLFTSLPPICDVCKFSALIERDTFNYKWLSFSVALRAFFRAVVQHTIYFTHALPTRIWRDVELLLARSLKLESKCVIYHSDKCFFIERLFGAGRDTAGGSDEFWTRQRDSNSLRRCRAQEFGSWARQRRFRDAAKVRRVKADGNKKSIDS